MTQRKTSTFDLDRERYTLDQLLGIVALAAQLAEAWREHSKGCEQLMRSVQDPYERGRWLGCAAQAFGCAEDLERVLALGTSKGPTP